MTSAYRAARRWAHRRYRLTRQRLDPNYFPVRDRLARDFEKSTGQALEFAEATAALANRPIEIRLDGEVIHRSATKT